MHIITRGKLSIWMFAEYGFGFVYSPGWSIYILIGFIGISIIIRDRA